MTKHSTILTASVVFLAAGLSGCSRSDDAKQAVRESGRDFEMVAVGNANSSSSDALTSYIDAENLVAEFAGTENGYAEAAALGVARAKIGQASLASQEASIAESASLYNARIIRGHINEWLTMSAIAQAAGTFNPAEDLKELSGLIAMRQEDIATYRTLQDEIDSEIAGLESTIAELESNARSERAAGAEIELRIPDVSATEGAVLAERVREHTLRGDTFGLEAVRVMGRVEQLRPTAEEYLLNVGKAKSQIELLESAREELQERERSSKADAAEARAKAQTAHDAIVRLADEYASFRSSEVNSINAKAISLARGALAAARDSKNATAQVGALTNASSQQLLGECLARKAAGHAEAAILYNAIEESGVSGDWASRAGQERAEQESAHEESMQAFQAAASAIRGARVRGEVADKLEAAAARLDALGGVEPEPEYEDEYDEYEDDEYTDDSDDAEVEEDDE